MFYTLKMQNYKAAMERNLMLALFLCAGFSSFSQEEVGTELRQNKSQSVTVKAEEAGAVPKGEVKKNQTITISKRPGEPQRVHDKNYYQEEIAKIDNQISAIDTKIEYVKSDPQEKKLAEESGWFTEMEATKEKLRAERTNLEQKLNAL